MAAACASAAAASMPRTSATTRLEDVRRAEAEAGLDTDAAYEGFTPKVEAIRAGLLDFLNTEKAAGRTVAAYGAAAKGNTLLNYCGIGTDLIAYVADLSPHKQGLYLPGSQIPILSPLHLTQTKPDNVLILPWNLRNEIVGQLDHLEDIGHSIRRRCPVIGRCSNRCQRPDETDSNSDFRRHPRRSGPYRRRTRPVCPRL